MGCFSHELEVAEHRRVLLAKALDKQLSEPSVDELLGNGVSLRTGISHHQDTGIRAIYSQVFDYSGAEKAKRGGAEPLPIEAGPESSEVDDKVHISRPDNKFLFSNDCQRRRKKRLAAKQVLTPQSSEFLAALVKCAPWYLNRFEALLGFEICTASCTRECEATRSDMARNVQVSIDTKWEPVVTSVDGTSRKCEELVPEAKIALGLGAEIELN